MVKNTKISNGKEMLNKFFTKYNIWIPCNTPQVTYNADKYHE